MVNSSRPLRLRWLGAGRPSGGTAARTPRGSRCDPTGDRVGYDQSRAALPPRDLAQALASRQGAQAVHSINSRPNSPLRTGAIAASKAVRSRTTRQRVNGGCRCCCAGWRTRPDVVCLQELKAPDERFRKTPSPPRLPGDLARAEELERGRLLSRVGEIHETRRTAASPTTATPQYRSRGQRVLNRGALTPQRNPPPGPKFDYKRAGSSA